ncbi:MAG: ATP-binding cassette domain-containing protein [Chlamydiae bacterium]|nr:ATP-binding cassette domain-containing protein [Chlamydiota bacterium]
MSIITCNQVVKVSDAEKPLLNGIDLEIDEEEFIMISGPPGAGKSTLLSILGGYLTPTSGSVSILGKNLFQMNAFEKAKFRRENLGVVFQNGRLIASLTVLENILVPLLSSNQSKKNSTFKALNVLNYMGIEEKKDSYLDELSGAELQLVSLSRALINEPKVLLLDEPTQFLDHQTGVKVMTYLREMAIDHQITIISILNDVRLFPFASRVIRMKSGRVVDVLGDFLIDSPFLRI